MQLIEDQKTDRNYYNVTVTFIVIVRPVTHADLDIDLPNWFQILS